MLTPKQHQTLVFIKDYIRQHDYAPTTGEIARGIGIRSRGVAHRYLKALEQAGHITLQADARRNIRLLDIEGLDITGIPLMGKIAAGLPIEAVSNPEVIHLHSLFLGNGRYALKVMGDSMIEDGILDGDIVICQHSATARNNQIVVALIDNEVATLKRLQYLSNDHICLRPANHEHAEQLYAADRVKIQGIFIGLIRLTT